MAFVGTRDDLAKIHFKVFPHLAYVPRMLLAAAAVGLGLVIQLQRPTIALIVGAAFVFFGILLTLVDAKTNAPRGLRGEPVWERVTPEQYARIRALVAGGKRWARRDLFGAGNLLGQVIFVGLAACLVALFLYLRTTPAKGRLAAVFAWDGGMFLVLTYFVGARKAWKPEDLLVKIDVLQTVLDGQAARPIARLKFQPMLEIHKNQRSQQLPRDARLLVTIDKAPEALIGFQVQCSINRVGAAAYPYVYAVIIARKAFDLNRRLAGVAVGAKDLLTFEEADEEVDVAVLRQKTTKTSGYHTRPADQQRIFRQAAQLALTLANQ